MRSTNTHAATATAEVCTASAAEVCTATAAKMAAAATNMPSASTSAPASPWTGVNSARQKGRQSNNGVDLDF
jgi:hypothetical protein